MLPLRAVDPWSEFLPPELHELLGALLSLEPTKRPTALEAEATLARLLKMVAS